MTGKEIYEAISVVKNDLKQFNKAIETIEMDDNAILSDSVAIKVLKKERKAKELELDQLERKNYDPAMPVLGFADFFNQDNKDVGSCTI
jgi:hypothetical protein